MTHDLNGLAVQLSLPRRKASLFGRSRRLGRMLGLTAMVEIQTLQSSGH